MLWIYLVVVVILLFIGLLFFFRHVLTGNISKATQHLEELSKDYLAKEEEANKLIEKAQKESKGIVARETQAAEEAKEKLIKEAQEAREQILKEANKRGAEIAAKAERNAEFLRKELDQKIDERAKEKVFTYIQQTVPQKFLQDIHGQWIAESAKSDLNLKNLKIPEKTKEAKVQSAFSLTDKQQEDIKDQLKKKIGAGIVLKVEVDPSLIAGFVITIGSVVIDASLKYKILKVMQE